LRTGKRFLMRLLVRLFQAAITSPRRLQSYW